LENNKISEEKLKIIRRVVWFLRFVPFMRMAAITGRVAMKNAEKSSDLDLLIVLKHGHIFTGRILTTFLVHLLGKRRYGRKIKDRICLNYFITTKSLEISNQDLFASSEYFFVRPAFGFKVFRKFQMKNSWIKNYHPNFNESDLAERCLVKDSYFSKKIRKAGEKIFGFNFIEKTLKNWQVKRIANDPRTHKPGSMVEANDNELIFLPEPQGPEVFEKYQEKLEKMKIS
jgi:predicted nucleotidyltransferase